MTEDNKMKVVCEFNGNLVTLTANPNLTVVANALKNVPGVGKPFLAFASLASNPSFCDFDHPSICDANGDRIYVVTSNTATNYALINQCLAAAPAPLDALTF